MQCELQPEPEADPEPELQFDNIFVPTNPLLCLPEKPFLKLVSFLEFEDCANLSQLGQTAWRVWWCTTEVYSKFA